MKVTVETTVHVGDESVIVANHFCNTGSSLEELVCTTAELIERTKREAIGALHLDWENPE